MLRAIIFDFDGVLVDSEPLIYRIVAQMAQQQGWTVTEQDYFQNYLALDDRGIVERLFETHGKKIDRAQRDEWVAWKFRTYAEEIRDGLPALPGAVDFVRRVATQFPLAIASGSLRSEVEHLVTKLGLRESFKFLVTAEDTAKSKPEPEIYLKALAALNSLEPFRAKPLKATECLAIEDAPGGIRAAQSAGIKCLALSHSRPADELGHANWLVRDFAEVDFDGIQKTFD